MVPQSTLISARDRVAAASQPATATQACSAYLDKQSEIKNRKNTLLANSLSETQRKLVSFENEKIRKIRKEV